MSGGQIRTYNVVRELCLRHEVELFASRSADLPTGKPALATSYTFRADSPLRSLYRVLRGLQPLPVARYASSRLSRALSSRAYDRVIIDHLASSYISETRAKTALVAHNVEHALWFARSERGGALRRNAYRLLASQMLEYERRRVAGHHLVAFTSKVDQSILGRWAQHSVVLENGVDTAERAFLPDLPSAPALLFPGSLEYWPNADALGYFFDAIFPEIVKTIPGVRLEIAGYSRSDPNHLIPARFRGHAVATANVPEMAAHYSSSRAMIVPLRAGSGSRLKVLEAMAMGRPVISTTKGVEGLELEADEHFLRADTPEEFSGQVIRVLRDDALAQRLRRSARSYVVWRYDWKSVARPFVEAIESL
jgi:glycosyltransferase involved in cell wall biosynthesis